MNSADLAGEYCAALRRTTLAEFRLLIEAGVPSSAIALAAPAAARITVDRRTGTYQPDDDGRVAFVMPVRVDDPISPEASDPSETIRRGPIVDLVAFHPARPLSWAVRTGAAEWLGAVRPQIVEPFPVPVSRAPMGWLRSGCHGVVILSAERISAYGVLTWFTGGIIAEDNEHAAELRRQLERPWPGPRVIAADREVRRAACQRT
jgi:hypothetical protein